MVQLNVDAIKDFDSNLERDAFLLILDYGLPTPQRQYDFDPQKEYPKNRFRADFAWPNYSLIMEIDGGLSIGRKCPYCRRQTSGSHNSHTGYNKDRERDAIALSLGYTVFRVTKEMIYNGRMISVLTAILER